MEGSGRVFTAEEFDALPRAELVELVRTQASLIELLMARVERLEAEASRNSANSSRPPSNDTQKRRAQRAEAKPKGAGRSRGKQPGAEGHRLSPVLDPDVRVRHAPHGCCGCGASLDDAEVVGTESRQVFDIPEPTPFVTEHTAERRRCSCGRTTTGAFPPEATAPACYGPRLRALAIYMLCRQHLPVQRCAEMLSDVLGVPVSTGWLSGLVAEAGSALVPFVGHVSTLLGRSPVVGADETGGRVGVAKRWFHVLCTPALSLIVCHRSRGMEAVNDIGVLPDYRGVIVHDGLALYDSLGASHAQCNAHLVRHLTAVGEVWDQTAWTKAMTTCLFEAKHAADAARGEDGDARHVGDPHRRAHRGRRQTARGEQWPEVPRPRLRHRSLRVGEALEQLAIRPDHQPATVERGRGRHRAGLANCCLGGQRRFEVVRDRQSLGNQA